MTVDLDVSVFNFEAGGLSRGGSFDFTGLHQAFLADPSPDLIVLCEAKFWHQRGKQPFLDALLDLSLMHDRPYVGELHTGPLGTALIYDPNSLHLVGAEEPEFPDKRNLARFQLSAEPLIQMEVFAEHWSYCDAPERLARARRLGQYGIRPLPLLVAGDLNESASGPDFPDLDWNTVPLAVRDYVARQLPDGTWVSETGALDRLIGRHDPETGARVDGSGFHHVAEQDPDAARPFAATSNVRDLHVDHAVANDALLRIASVVPGSYRIHIPRGNSRADWPSDHRRVSFTLRFASVIPDARNSDTPADSSLRMAESASPGPRRP